MSWSTGNSNWWHFNPSKNGMTIGALTPSGFKPITQSPTSAGVNEIFHLNYVETAPKAFLSSKTYQFETTIITGNLGGLTFSLDPGHYTITKGTGGISYYLDAEDTSYWVSDIDQPNRIVYSGNTNPLNSMIPVTGTKTLQFFTSPSTNISTEYIATYGATAGLAGNISNYSSGANFIKKLAVNECDFQIQGYAIQKEPEQGICGWVHNSGTYSWNFYSNPIRNAIGSYKVGTTYTAKADSIYNVNNFIAKKLESNQLFNLSFNLDFSAPVSGPMINQEISMYLTDTLPNSSTSIPTSGLLVATFTQSNTYNFYNINGGQYLYFVGRNNSNYKASIGNISIKSGYSIIDNNELFQFTPTTIYNEPTPLSIIGATDSSTYEYTAVDSNTTHFTISGPVGPKKISGSGITTEGFFSNIYGVVTGLTQLHSKAGNGTFKSGVWENGVWNNGWRVDNNVFEFNDVSVAIHLNTIGNRWRIQIDGATHSVSEFEISDKVSIGNIVAIDINDKRKLLKNYFTIVDKSETSLIIEVDSNFPFRRIEKDSDNHKILITKNVWLNGAFFNGYFEGVWNDGLFKGYPYITEMYNSHWIDGKFQGGHFHSEKPSYNFTDTYYWNGYVGLTFGATAHGLLQGDYITVNKTDKTINPSYDGDFTITEVVDDYLAITDIRWGDSSTDESGVVTRRTSTGLIQNFKFWDNNTASKTSINTNLLKDIWRYESWIDVNYSNDSTTNINSDKIYNNPSTLNFNDWISKQKFGVGDYGILNLHGNITEDILSSDSYFRGVNSTAKKSYRLGTKYDIYEDFLGDISNFNNPFNSDPEFGDLDNFYLDGWTFSFSGIEGGSQSYLNSLVLNGTTFQQSILSADDIIGSWESILFSSTPYQNNFGTGITFSSVSGFLPLASDEITISDSGVFDININIPAKFTTTANAVGSISGDDYLYIDSNQTVGAIKLIKYSNDTKQWVEILKRDIKTSGSPYFNVGTENFPKSGITQSSTAAIFNSDITLFLDWKGELKAGDKVKFLFQKCSTKYLTYNKRGPWSGSGFDNILGFGDKIKTVTSSWLFLPSRKLTINKSVNGRKFGYNFKRTSDGTFLVEHESDSFHSLTLNNSNINIPKNRYSMIEFDLLQSPDTYYETLTEAYNFHWTTLYNFTNFISSDLSYSNYKAFPSEQQRPSSVYTVSASSSITGLTYSISVNPSSKSALWSGVDYTKTKSLRKREFFYNRPGLDLGLISEQTNGFRSQVHELDNIKFYEVDMIPFFKYTTEEYVDKRVKIPYQGKAPVIDYSNANFSFIDNISIGSDSISLKSVPMSYIFNGI